ncbi:MAG: NUDIX domain-containing protein [Planctomycetota bacterium]
MIAKERVYVVPRAELFPDRAPHGFFRAGPEFFGRIYARGFFAERDRVEEDPSLKQVIPYALVAREQRVFLCRRTDRGGERRLHGMLSVGVGGHVNPQDAGDVIHDALRRELAEELVLPPRYECRVVGLVNNDTTPVGSVHIGVVAVVDPGPFDVKVREEDTMSGGFVSRADLVATHVGARDSFEGWSALLLDRLDEVLAWGRPQGSSTPIPKATPTSTT